MAEGLPPRLVVGAPALVAVVALLAVNRLGPDTLPDSVFYVGTARNLLDGHGLRAPPGTQELSNFPPLLPLLLAGVGRVTGMDPLDVLRWLNPLLFGATVALAGAEVRRRTGSAAAGAVTAVLVLTGRDLLGAHASALSEPLFILLAVGGMVALARSVDGAGRRWFWAASVLVAAAFLTRYVGVAVVLAGLALLVRAGRRRDAAIFAAVTILPVAAWLAWAGPGAGHLAVHWFGLEYLARGARSLSDWVVPTFVPAPLRVAAAALLVAGAAALLRRVPGPRADRLTFVLGSFAGLYVALLLLDRVLIDASGRLDRRFLSPLHVVVIMLVVPLGHRAWETHLRGRRPVVAAAAALVVLQVVQAVAWVGGGLTDDGIARRGYSAAAWSRSPVLSRVRELGPEVPVFSNGADAVFLLTGRETAALPARVDYRTGRENPHYAAELATVGAALARGGVLVYFQAITARRSFLPPAAELEAGLGLRVVERDEVGTLYRLSVLNSSATWKARSRDWRALSRGSQAVR